MTVAMYAEFKFPWCTAISYDPLHPIYEEEFLNEEIHNIVPFLRVVK